MTRLYALFGAGMGLFAVLALACARWYIQEDPFVHDLDRYIAELEADLTSRVN